MTYCIFSPITTGLYFRILKIMRSGIAVNKYNDLFFGLNFDFNVKFLSYLLENKWQFELKTKKGSSQ